jgi:arylsulfatase A-like enzyme
MPARTTAIATLTIHVLLWIVCVALSLAYVHLSDDPWYVATRTRYLGSFFLVHLAILPIYVLIAGVVFAWLWTVLRFWESVRPSSRGLRRLLLLTLWFWLTAGGVSLITHFSAWLVPVQFLRQSLNLDITYRVLHALRIPVWSSCVLLLLTTAVSVARLPAVPLKGAAAAVLALAMVTGPAMTPAPRAASTSYSRAPHLVIIGSDSLRADHLGCYGYARNTSPTIDALANEGVLCERMYAPAPSTLESLLAMMTGRSLHELDVHTIFPTRDAVERLRRFPTVASALRERGYRTVAVGDWAASNFGRIIGGFDVNDVDGDMRFTDYMDAAVRRCHIFPLAFFMTPLTAWAAPDLTAMIPASRTPRQIQARIDSEIADAARTGRPLFLFAFVSTTHLPYGVPADEPVVFGDPSYGGRHHRQIDFTVDELVHDALNDVSADDRRRAIDLYDSCVRAFDTQVARVVRSLESHGISEETLLVVLSDHGDDHWEPGTGLSRTIHAGDQSIRIPLIMRWPGRLHARRVRNVLHGCDLAPTLADLLGVRWEVNAAGRSFRPRIEGDAAGEGRPAFVEAGMSWAGPARYPPEGDHLSYPGITDLVSPDFTWHSHMIVTRDMLSRIMKAKDRALITDRWKLVYQPLRSGPRVEMFDIAADPHCRVPQRPDPDLAQRLKSEIERDPPEYYLAWERAVFDAAFEPVR